MYLFNIFVLLCCVFVIVQSRPGGPDEEYPPAEFLRIMKPLHEDCAKRLDISDDEIANYVITDNREKMMCYMKCLMEEMELMRKEKEEINYELIEENLHTSVKEIGMQMVDKCLNTEVSSDECVTVYNFNVCLQREDPEHWFLP